jgi:hypothetical protein
MPCTLGARAFLSRRSCLNWKFFLMAGLRQEGSKTVGTLIDYQSPAQALAMIATASSQAKKSGKKGKGKKPTKTEEAAADAKPSAENNVGRGKHAGANPGQTRCLVACKSTEHRIAECGIFQRQ